MVDPKDSGKDLWVVFIERGPMICVEPMGIDGEMHYREVQSMVDIVNEEFSKTNDGPYAVTSFRDRLLERLR